MRLRVVMIFIILIILLVFFSAAYLFLFLEGKNIITAQLANATGKKVTIAKLRISPPLVLKLSGLDIEGMVKADSVVVSPAIWRMLTTGQLAFNEIRIRSPQFTFEKMLPPKPAQPASGQATEAAAPKTEAVVPVSAPTQESEESTEARPKKRLPYIFVKRFFVKDGLINIIDYTAGPNGITIAIHDININVTNLVTRQYPVATSFDLDGRIPWGQNSNKVEGNISMEGWINLYKKDMEASLKVTDIDGIYLHPYYAKWVDLEKSRIEKAKLNFTSKIHGLNNNVTAESHLELTDIVFKPRSPEEQKEKAEKIADVVLDTFKTMDQGKIVLDFNLRTRMDRPEFGFDMIKDAVEDKITSARGTGMDAGGIFKLPVKLIEGTVRSATELTSSVITGTIKAGGEIKKSVEDVFKKKEKKK